MFLTLTGPSPPVAAAAALPVLLLLLLLPCPMLLLPVCTHSDDSMAVQPADSRVVVFDTVDAAHKFW
jgi:hypothetical protein